MAFNKVLEEEATETSLRDRDNFVVKIQQLPAALEFFPFFACTGIILNN